MRKQQKKKMKNRIKELYHIFIGKPIYSLKSFIEYNIIEKTINAFSRAVKGYSFRDVWDFENWFVHIVPRMIEEVKNRSPRVVPLFENGDVDEDCIKHIYRDGEREEWHKILDTIIEEFEYVQKFYEDEDVIDEGHKRYYEMIKHRDNAFKLLFKYFDYYGW